ncbi:MAG: ABC transporter substrate-binding protein [Flavobacteriales bacterium]|nr:ABC transporter substrate-binding protein [Flavobacteriales bacterium]
MRGLLTIFVGLTLVFSSCSGDLNNANSTTTAGVVAAKGGKIYGGTLNISQSENLYNLFPPGIVDVYTHVVASHVFESLVKFDAKTLAIQPCVAEEWDISVDGLVYTFKIKKGIKFHDDDVFGGEGRELTAKDVQFSIELACTQHPQNIMFVSTLQDRLLGANAYYEASADGAPANGLEGVKIIDDYTIQLTLVKPFSPFISVLTSPALSIIPEEAYKKYGVDMTIGSGPFMVPEGQRVDDDSKIILVRNPNYHRSDSLGNQLPFLDTLQILIIDSKKAELEEFEKENLHIVDGLPAESIRKIVEQQIANFQNKPPKFLLDRGPTMGTEYYEFNTQHEALSDKRVRQALNYAIDRNKIIDKVLKGEAYGPGENGICPPTFSGYDISSISGYTYDLNKAKQLMAEAGYPNGMNFPTIKLELNSGGYKNTSVAFEIQKQLMDNLNVNIDLEVVPFAQKLQDEQYGRADNFRSAWLADYPNPQNFLFLFYGKYVPEDMSEPSYPNVTRYVNPEYDRLYDLALSAQSQEESYALLAQAESIMMEDAPIMVLWYNEKYKLIQSNVRNFYTNPMNHRDFSIVYFKVLSEGITEKGQ